MLATSLFTTHCLERGIRGCGGGGGEVVCVAVKIPDLLIESFSLVRIPCYTRGYLSMIFIFDCVTLHETIVRSNVFYCDHVIRARGSCYLISSKIPNSMHLPLEQPAAIVSPTDLNTMHLKQYSYIPARKIIVHHLHHHAQSSGSSKHFHSSSRHLAWESSSHSHSWQEE